MNPATNWSTAWAQTMGLPGTLPPAVTAAIALLFLFWLVILPSGALIHFIQRKLVADFQARIGPNRAGPGGVFQPMADMLKLLQKAHFSVETRGQWFWLAVHTMALYSTLAVLPLGSAMVMVDTDMTVFLPFWAALVLALGTMLLGLSQGSVSGWFGGIRVAAQSLAGAFPALVALLSAGLAVGGFRWSVFAGTQSASPVHWIMFRDPFLFLGSVVFLLSGLVLFGISPLDGGGSLNDLHGGVSASLYGNRLGLYRISRFYGFFLWTAITVVIFMGGWSLPFGLSDSFKASEQWSVLQISELGWVLFKTFALMIGIIWVSSVNPRARVDQVTDFALRVLSPASLVVLICEGGMVAWRALR